MDCKEAEKMIPHFLKDELQERQLRAFLHHVEHCGDCKEELSIQYLVVEGMARLEAGGNLNLQMELNGVLEEYRRVLKADRITDWILLGVQAGVAAVMIMIVMWVILV